MADAVPDTETVLEFVNRHYAKLKREAQDDNTANENITRVIDLIDGLFDTVNKKADATHDEIAGQLKALKTNYNELGAQLDLGEYTRYIDANDSLNMIVDGLEEVEAGVGVGGEHEPAPRSTASGPVVSPASESALVPEPVVSPASETALAPSSRESRELVPALAPSSRELVPVSRELVPVSRELVPA
jgi:uncharacterized protein YeeX (DUF496 family)